MGLASRGPRDELQSRGSPGRAPRGDPAAPRGALVANPVVGCPPPLDAPLPPPRSRTREGRKHADEGQRSSVDDRSRHRHGGYHHAVAGVQPRWVRCLVRRYAVLAAVCCGRCRNGDLARDKERPRVGDRDLERGRYRVSTVLETSRGRYREDFEVRARPA